ncbi:MAG: DUF58 domain-containing protein [Pseudomonadales bacterium]|nr:DUF58 domain-containing protein [Pseudomonadales bacterium]
MSLTPLSILFTAFIALVGVADQWSEHIAFVAWRYGAVVLVLALAYEWWWVRRCRLRASVLATRLYLGRMVNVEITLHNGERRPIRVELAPHLPQGFAIDGQQRSATIEPLGSHSETVETRPLKLGVRTWEELPARVKGPLGLSWGNKPCALGTHLRVVPDLLGRRSRPAGIAPTGSIARTLAGTGQELDHLRDYQAGDPRHTVDWKASARASKLITRVMSDEQHLSVILVVDAGRTGRSRIDGMNQLGHYINTAARFAEHAVANDDQVGLVVAAEKPVTVLAPARGTRAVTRIRAALTDLDAAPTETDLVAAALAVQRLVRHRCLIVLLTDLYGQAGTGGLMQSVRLWVPKHLPVVTGLVAEEVDRLASAEAKEWLDPHVALAATDYRRGLANSAAGLRHVGAIPLITRAATLESRVLEQYHLLKMRRRV